MLSYQHQYHAGNHADVLKHWVLLHCVHHMQKKAKPFDYIDTHSGAGRYQLDSAEATKTGEAKEGVLKVDWSNIEGMHQYAQAIAKDLKKGRYPGSPMLVNRLLREGDHAWLYEMHPQTVELLRSCCERKRVVYVKQEDGFKGLLSLLPPKSRRALVLIDPSYEIKADYQRVVDVVIDAYQKFPQAVILIWYPVVDRRFIGNMQRDLKNSGINNIQQFEMGIEDESNKGMTASGVFAINPPYTLKTAFEETMPKVSELLSVDETSRTRSTQLVSE